MLTRKERQLTVTFPDKMRRQMIQIAAALDINKAGYYDGSGGMVVNVWCGPEDKPDCWDVPITKGALHYHREFLGTIRFNELSGDSYQIVIEASPYELYEKRPRHRKPSPEEMDEILDWIEKKAKELLNLAETHQAQIPVW